MKLGKYLLSAFGALIIYSSLNSQVTSVGMAVKFLSEKIGSNEYRVLKSRNNDLALLDSIYQLSLTYFDDDISESLLALTFTTLPYNEIPVVIPLLRIKLDVPLVSVAEPGFSLKNENLPGSLFYDTPEHELKDKDKLAHFFGSAFLAYNSRLFDLTEIIAIFVEDFEETFYVQSSVDLRDIRTDHLGNMFGKALKKNKKVMPSEFFILYPLIYFRYNL